MHWSKRQVTVHSGIVKVNGIKEYHPYLTEDNQHDQALVWVNLERLVDVAAMRSPSAILVESDNGNDYKSAQHFFDVQRICDKVRVPIIRAYGTPEHCKHEVDHVGGVAKMVLRRAVASGEFFEDVGAMVEFLEGELEDKEGLKYVVKEIDREESVVSRNEASRSKYVTVQGTTSFRVMYFEPDKSSFKASKRICVCEMCTESYGSCSNFNEFYPQVISLKAPPRRPKDKPVEVSAETDVVEFLPPLSVVAVAPERKSNLPVWFMQIKSHIVADQEMAAEYGLVEAGQQVILAYHLEQHGENTTYMKFERGKREQLLFKESVVYPYVEYEFGKKETQILLRKTDYADILNYVDTTGLTTI